MNDMKHFITHKFIITVFKMYLNIKYFKVIHTSKEVPRKPTTHDSKAFKSIINPFFYASMGIAHIFLHSKFTK